MYDRILVPLENSRTDEAVMAHVALLARQLGSAVILLHVADGWAARTMTGLDLRESEEIQKDRAYLKEMCGRLESQGVTVDAVLAAGEPAREIAAVAERERCQLIAMATHGHRLFDDLLKGSTATALRHATTIPILMIRGERS
jgi:nucleotide-binding universal stress UspA family protein